jgi:hypothetical protein
MEPDSWSGILVRGDDMLRKLLILFTMAAFMGACASEPPPSPPPPQQVAATAPTSNVFFDWDSTKLSTTALNVLEQARDAFKMGGANARVTATGHTDTSGSPEYNQGLSVRRANAVKNELVRQGVPAAAITATGVGEAGLLVPTADGVREPQNRRVEVMVSGATAAAPMTNEMAYCHRLSELYRRNVTRGQADAIAGDALAKCQAGDTRTGIPILEKLLTDARVPLPPRA